VEAGFQKKTRHVGLNEHRQPWDKLPKEQWEILRGRHPGGDAQIKAILASTKSFATSYDDLNFTPLLLSTIQARTFIIQGDRDPLYPVELSVENGQSYPSLPLVDHSQRRPRPRPRCSLARVPPNRFRLPAGVK